MPPPQNVVEQERKDIAHDSAPMTPTSRASCSRSLLSVVRKYRLSFWSARANDYGAEPHLGLCLCLDEQLPTFPSSLRQTAVTEAAARAPCLAGMWWLHEPGRGWRQR